MARDIRAENNHLLQRLAELQVEQELLECFGTVPHATLNDTHLHHRFPHMSNVVLLISAEIMETKSMPCRHSFCLSMVFCLLAPFLMGADRVDSEIASFLKKCSPTTPASNADVSLFRTFTLGDISVNRRNEIETQLARNSIYTEVSDFRKKFKYSYDDLEKHESFRPYLERFTLAGPRPRVVYPHGEHFDNCIYRIGSGWQLLRLAGKDIWLASPVERRHVTLGQTLKLPFLNILGHDVFSGITIATYRDQVVEVSNRYRGFNEENLAGSAIAVISQGEKNQLVTLTGVVFEFAASPKSGFSIKRVGVLNSPEFAKKGPLNFLHCEQIGEKILAWAEFAAESGSGTNVKRFDCAIEAYTEKPQLTFPACSILGRVNSERIAVWRSSDNKVGIVSSDGSFLPVGPLMRKAEFDEFVRVALLERASEVDVRCTFDIPKDSPEVPDYLPFFQRSLLASVRGTVENGKVVCFYPSFKEGHLHMATLWIEKGRDAIYSSVPTKMSVNNFSLDALPENQLLVDERDETDKEGELVAYSLDPNELWKRTVITRFLTRDSILFGARDGSVFHLPFFIDELSSLKPQVFKLRK